MLIKSQSVLHFTNSYLRLLSARSTLTALILSITCFTTNAQANNCYIDAYQEYTIIQSQWQRSLNELVNKQYPRFENVNTHYLKAQLAIIERNRIAFPLVLANMPDRVNVERHISQWLDINDEVFIELSKSDKGAREAHRIVKERLATDPHKDGDMLRALMRNKVLSTHLFLEMLSKYNTNVNSLKSKHCDANSN